MKTAPALSSLIVLAATTALTGCASIVSGRHADVAIDTYPSNAHVEVRDNSGHTVASIETPGTVSLKRNRRWFLPARYTAVIEAPGYDRACVPIRSTVNPWVLGNVVVGGVPGLIVDNATGAVWQPKQSEIHCQLNPDGSPIAQTAAATEEPPTPNEESEPQRLAARPK